MKKHISLPFLFFFSFPASSSFLLCLLRSFSYFSLLFEVYCHILFLHFLIFIMLSFTSSFYQCTGLMNNESKPSFQSLSYCYLLFGIFIAATDVGTPFSLLFPLDFSFCYLVLFVVSCLLFLFLPSILPSVPRSLAH